MKNKKPLPKVTKNEVFAWILAGLMIFWTIASVLGIIGFAGSCENGSNLVTASAETADSVENGQYYIHIHADTVFYAAQSLDVSTQESEYLSVLSFDDGAYWFLFRVAFGTYDDGSVPTDTPYSYMAVDNVGDLVVTQDFYLPINNDFSWTSPQIAFTLRDINDFSTVIAEYYTDDNSSAFITVDFRNRLQNSVEDSYSQGYQDGLAKGREEAAGGDFEDGYNAAKDYFYDVGYADGKEDGLRQGKQLGRTEGIALGKEEGILLGKDIGFAEGVASAGDYSFMSLMSSVIDAPVQAFKGLFSFELLGVDLAGFALGMLSLCAVLAVIRVVL